VISWPSALSERLAGPGRPAFVDEHIEPADAFPHRGDQRADVAEPPIVGREVDDLRRGAEAMQLV
jgi:hypothetical protein